ncbi:hypothetical protein N0V90_003465 [Kalmusia sp. IMI 367209]|nr:hypothetical protein N0V90_003465 [Kalmusia sp. IMI 367209]
MIVLKLLTIVGLAVTSSLSESLSPPFCGNPFALTLKNLATFANLANGTISPAQGSADLLGMQQYGGPRPWPRNSENKVVIQYCFEFASTRQKLQSHFKVEGIDAWLKMLGPASPETGHGLEFEETLDEHGNPLYCYDSNGVGPGNNWNPQLSFNTLVIVWSHAAGFSGSSTIGFVQEIPPVPYAMKIMFGEGNTDPIMVHEIGHALGMAHEHQRDDRHHHVEYRCHNVFAFDAKYAKLKRDNPFATTKDLCDNIVNAVKYDFKGADFVQTWAGGDPRWRDGHGLFWQVASRSDRYDSKSIMHYPSAADLKPGEDCTASNTAPCTLVGNDDEGRIEKFLPWRVEPSRLDIEWVVKTYPWMDPN